MDRDGPFAKVIKTIRDEAGTHASRVSDDGAVFAKEYIVIEYFLITSQQAWI